MEKNVALREWCLDRASSLMGGCHFTGRIEYAEAYEAYLTGKEIKKACCSCGQELKK